MRRATFLLLVFLSVSWASSLGQSAPKLTTPQIVATFQRLNQTKEIKPVTLYTPPQWGTFRVSIVMVLTVGNGNQNTEWDGWFRFVDGAGMSQYVLALPGNTPQRTFAEFPIRVKPGTPLTFAVKPLNDPSGSKYNVWVVVEQLM